MRDLQAAVSSELSRLRESGELPAEAGGFARLALDYRAFALMQEFPARISRLAQRLVAEQRLGLEPEQPEFDRFRSRLCLHLAALYEAQIDRRGDSYSGQ